MKKTIIIFVFLSYSISLFSQDMKKSKINFGISFGLSIPISNFGSSDMENSEAGLAKLGYNANIRAKYVLSKNIGIIAIYTSNSNSFNASILEDEFRLQYPSLGISINSGNYISRGILGGIFIKTLITNLISFETRALVGYSKSYSPEIELRLSDGINHFKATIVKDDEKSLSFSVGAGLNYNVKNNLVISLNVDYYYTKPEFEITTISEFIPSSTDKNEQKFNILNTNMGIEYKF